MAPFTFTFRCPDCLRDEDFEHCASRRHRTCPEHEGKRASKPMVLVAIDGTDVSTERDPKH